MATKAVHIELVEDLTTESFLAALKRFIAQRGKVKNMYSDNGRNFVGADRALQQVLKDKKFNRTVQEFATEERMHWHFIPSRSPHYGGLWESTVRSMGAFHLTIATLTTTTAKFSVPLTCERR